MLARGPTCTQLHKTNVMIAHARDSNIPADLAKIKAQIDEKFTDVFIYKTSSVVCRGCNKEISLIEKFVWQSVTACRKRYPQTEHEQTTIRFLTTDNGIFQANFDFKYKRCIDQVHLPPSNYARGFILVHMYIM